MNNKPAVSKKIYIFGICYYLLPLIIVATPIFFIFSLGLIVGSISEVNVSDLFTILGGASSIIALILALFIFNTWKSNKTKEFQHAMFFEILQQLKRAKSLTLTFLHGSYNQEEGTTSEKARVELLELLLSINQNIRLIEMLINTGKVMDKGSIEAIKSLECFWDILHCIFNSSIISNLVEVDGYYYSNVWIKFKSNENENEINDFFKKFAKPMVNSGFDYEFQSNDMEMPLEELLMLRFKPTLSML